MTINETKNVLEMFFALRGSFGQKYPSMSHKTNLSNKYYKLLNAKLFSFGQKWSSMSHKFP